MNSISGKITELNYLFNQEEEISKRSKLVTVTDEKNGSNRFVISNDSLCITGGSIDKLNVGDNFVGFYDESLPVILIYPPQYAAVAYAVNFPDTKNIKIDVFNEDLTSPDHQLTLNVSEETEIVMKNGEPYTGELIGETLAVIYTFTTRSIPAQTTPEKIIVMNKNV